MSGYEEHPASRLHRSRSTFQLRLSRINPHNQHGFKLSQFQLPARVVPGIQIHVKLSALVLLISVVLTGCTSHERSPDEIRKQTARATSTAARDARAMAQGVIEGLKQQRTVNINRASIADLKSLPGIDDAVAHRIIEHRPYSDSYELVKRRIITRREYDRISGKIEAR
ncbi:MAG TPA: helix-hairpin-helix domain-containing protein [Terracidiphilus sp.]|nr:helix-hairpin-helix domain-containing protein [Terracidiphilus sp.]